MTIFVNFDRA